MYLNQELREELELVSGWEIPKCDVLGYLLRELPRTYKGVGLCVWAAGSSRWRAEYDNSHRVHFDADTPEDAAAKLAIELFKQGILKRETTDD